MTNSTRTHYQLNTHTSARGVHAIVTRNGRVLTTCQACTAADAVQGAMRMVRMVRHMGDFKRK
jgi:hypothetical protein